MAQSSIHSYCNDWNSLFGGTSQNVVSIENLKRICIEGRLQGSRFRSVCWMLLLNCLPPDKSRWRSSASEWRAKFEDLKRQYDIDPHGYAEAPYDVQHNNPLSLDTQNPWQQYFADSELKGSIRQDVERTFPELKYFQEPIVREMMIKILFIYARENPHVSYKQGMHEILGPLIFVLFFGHETFEHASKEDGFEIMDSQSRELLSMLSDEKYLEHDAYEMFTQIMLIIQTWYYFADEQDQRSPKRNSSPNGKKASKAGASGDGSHRLLQTEPFARVQDIGQSSVLVQKLNWIGDNLVQHSDPQLYNHLEKLEIPPQIYGIRWLRLLFGREFPIQDLLLLWDAIFADGPPFALVDYIFVAMLIFIRDLLLVCDYTGCLHYLMRYPPVTDTNHLLAVALHLQNPQKYPKPSASTMQTNFSAITISGRPHPNMQRQGGMGFQKVSSPVQDGTSFAATVNKKSASFLRKLNKASAAAAEGILEPIGKVDVAVSHAIQSDQHCGDIQKQRQQMVVSSKGQRPQYQQRNGNKITVTGKRSPGAIHRVGSISEEEMELLKEQISCLQVRLSDVEENSHIVADKLVACADSLSDRLSSLTLAPDDEAYKMLDRMRQLCRILKGTELLEMEQQNTTTKWSEISPDVRTGTVTEGWNSPVEIGNDPARTSPMINPLITGPHRQQPRPGNHPESDNQTARRGSCQSYLSSSSGAAEKHIPVNSGLVAGGGRPKLGVENELKEISRLKTTSSYVAKRND